MKFCPLLQAILLNLNYGFQFSYVSNSFHFNSQLHTNAFFSGKSRVITEPLCATEYSSSKWFSRNAYEHACTLEMISQQVRPKPKRTNMIGRHPGANSSSITNPDAASERARRFTLTSVLHTLVSASLGTAGELATLNGDL